MILYGSLYPWRFQGEEIPYNPLILLLHSWRGGRLFPFQIRDGIINVLLYIPVGACGYLAFAGMRRRWLAFWAPVALGAALSVTVEILQVYERTRTTSLLDVYANTIGSAVGVLAGVVFSRLSRRLRGLDPAAILVLLFWAAYLTLPFLPAVAICLFGVRIPDLTRSVTSDGVRLAAAFSSWYTAGFLLDRAGLRPAWIWLAGFAAVMAAGMALSGFAVWSTALGMAAGVAAFAVPFPGRKAGAAVAMLALLLVWGLQPFRFQMLAGTFLWTPFGGFLDESWQRSGYLLVEKLFFYGAAVWSLNLAGLSMRSAGWAVAGLLLGVELLQMFLPGRTAEITDPLLALVLALAFHAFRGGPRGMLRAT